MMQRKIILDQEVLNITIRRLCQHLIENHQEEIETVVLGLQPRGVFFANRVIETLKTEFSLDIPSGSLDTTFHRDDFRRRESPKKASYTHVPFFIENKNVILIDDVLYTGRSVRAALDAMITFGRARKVELMVLIDRKFSRHLPVEANYIGRKVNTLESQKVEVEWKEQGFEKDNVWLVNTE